MKVTNHRELMCDSESQYPLKMERDQKWITFLMWFLSSKVQNDKLQRPFLTDEHRIFFQRISEYPEGIRDNSRTFLSFTFQFLLQLKGSYSKSIFQWGSKITIKTQNSGDNVQTIMVIPLHIQGNFIMKYYFLIFIIWNSKKWYIYYQTPLRMNNTEW